MKLFTIAFISLCISSSLFANEDPYYKISKIDVQEIDSPYWQEESSLPQIDVKKIIKSIDDAVILGKRVWKIIVAGKPVTEIDLAQSVDALPLRDGKALSAEELESWSLPTSKSFRVSYKNGYGKEVIAFTYIVTMNYGGSFEGHGKYLSQVHVKTKDIKVAWGYKFDATSSFAKAINHGTKEDPIMGLTFDITFKCNNVLKVLESTRTFHVTGRGEIVSLN